MSLLAIITPSLQCTYAWQSSTGERYVPTPEAHRSVEGGVGFEGIVGLGVEEGGGFQGSTEGEFVFFGGFGFDPQFTFAS